MRGLEAESLVRREVKEMGYTIPRLPSAAKLIALAARTGPKFLARAMESMEDEGLDLSCMDSWMIVDLVFGLDLIVKVGDYYVGIDVTVNTDVHKLDSKRRRLAARAPMHKGLGLKACIIFNPLEEDLEQAIQLGLKRASLESQL